MSQDLIDLRADSRVIWTEDVLRYADLDRNGHVNNSIFATLSESGRVDQISHIRPALPADSFVVVARLIIDFRREMHYPGRALTGSWYTRIGRSSYTVGQVITDGEAVTAEVESVCVLMDGATRRPLPIPDAARAIMERYLRAASAPA